MKILAPLLVVLIAAATMPAQTPALAPDLVVAADGSGNFKTVQEAVASIPKGGHERRIILIKDGVYQEKVRIDAACVTLRGQSRAGTRIEFALPASAGRGVVVINGDDCVIENLTIKNTDGVLGRHAFAVFGSGDRTVIQDSNIWSQGNDTLSLWRTANGQFSEDAKNHASPNGRYYHARLDVCGSVDFICPRGWCYMVDSHMTEVNPHTDAAMWHDGSRDPNMKFVMRGCRFDGPENFRLARHHHDAMFFFVDCTFAKEMRDFAPYRVIYPLNGGTPTPADIANNKEHDKTNIWGERAYYFNSHREGGDYAWTKDNLAAAPGAPTPSEITAKWTFGGTWDPERRDGPVMTRVERRGDDVALVFSEPVTVKGNPRLTSSTGGVAAQYASGSGSDTLVFKAAAGDRPVLDLAGGAIVACEAGATTRFVSTKLPQ